MKQLVLIAAFAAAISQFRAQTPVNPPAAAEMHDTQQPGKTPAERAAKDASWAEKELGLSADQKTRWQAASLERINANTLLREKIKASTDKTEKHSLMMQMRDNGKKFDDTVNGFLTADQKAKWEKAKQEKKDKPGNGKKHRGADPQK